MVVESFAEFKGPLVTQVNPDFPELRAGVALHPWAHAHGTLLVRARGTARATHDFFSVGKSERVMTTPTAMTWTTVAPSQALIVLPGMFQCFQNP
jgi:hypothetical protein